MSDKYEKEAAMLLGVYKLDGLQVSLLAANIQRIVAEEIAALQAKLDDAHAKCDAMKDEYAKIIEHLEADKQRMEKVVEAAITYRKIPLGSVVMSNSAKPGINTWHEAYWNLFHQVDEYIKALDAVKEKP